MENKVDTGKFHEVDMEDLEQEVEVCFLVSLLYSVYSLDNLIYRRGFQKFLMLIITRMCHKLKRREIMKF